MTNLSLKLLAIYLCFLSDRLKRKTTNKLESAMGETKCTLAKELSNCYDYFQFSGFFDLFGKIFLIAFKVSIKFSKT